MKHSAWIGLALMGATGFGCGQSSCVARGTRIATPRGRRRVEELVVGDEVLSVDVSTSELVPALITRMSTAHRECVRLTAGGLPLALTSDHPVYCPTERRYAPAGDWVLGGRKTLLLAGPERAAPAPVEGGTAYVGVHQVFDLTVDSPHENFVAEGVVVHNKRPIPPDSGRHDAGVDAGPTDAGRPDAGPADAGEGDAAVVDAGAVDGGE